MRTLRALSRLHPWRFVSTSTLPVGSPVPLSRSESLVKELSPIRNFLAIVTTIGAIFTFFLSRLEKLEERVAGLLREVDAKMAGVTTAVDAKVTGVANEVDAKLAGVTTAVDAKVAGIAKEVDAKVAGIVKEVDAKVAGVKEAADKTVRELMHRLAARPPTPTRSLTSHPSVFFILSPFLAVRPPQVKCFCHARGGFWSSRNSARGFICGASEKRSSVLCLKLALCGHPLPPARLHKRVADALRHPYHKQEYRNVSCASLPPPPPVPPRVGPNPLPA